MPVHCAFLFPGQGSQYPGMGKELYDNFPEARDVFDQAGEALGYDLAGLCFQGPEDQLNLTEKTQPAVLTASIAAERVLAGRDVRPVAAAGHSLGEYSALVSAGALAFRNAVGLVAKRGRFMQEAVPGGTGAMAAIIGLDREKVAGLCSRVSTGRVTAANFNSPAQTVIAGEREAVEAAVEVARKEGARKAVLLPMSVPSHCDLMVPARERLAKELDRTAFADLDFPLIANADAAETRSGDTARQGLKRQMTSPVRWVESMEKIAARTKIVVEVGPGRVLTGLMKRIDRDVRCLNVRDLRSLEEALVVLKKS